MSDYLQEIAYKKLRLNKEYRPINSNHIFGSDAMPFLKHVETVNRIKDKINYSEGGAFLFTPGQNAR